MQATRRDPAFWFGFGLSYTTFEYDPPWLDGDALVVRVRNVGRRAGDDVVQLYADRALGTEPRQLGTLSGFRRVTLAPGQAHEVRFALEPAWRRVHVGPSADPRTWKTVVRPG
jgi:beta-glucosidase